MNILAIDCCLKLTGAALMLDGVISGHEQEDLGRRQTSELPRMCERLMNAASLSWPELDYIAITNGPGYFTGIRVGAAYASGLAYASGAKVIPVSALDMLAFTHRKHDRAGRNILTVIYAGHGWVYASCDGFLEAGEYSHAEVLSWLEGNDDASVISDDPERTALDIPGMLQVRPDIVSLCEIAGEKVSLAVSPMELKISYYRAPQGVS